MNYKTVNKIYIKNQSTRNNTYLVPKINFDGFIRDELMFVQESSESLCTVFRTLDGQLYNLTKEQIENFKCVGSCEE